MAKNYDDAADRALGKVGNNTIGTANEEMTANAGSAARYAYIPSSPEICGFCCMMASRGFDFTYEAQDKLHDNCSCKKIPETDKKRIGSYDPEPYRERYELCRDTVRRLLTGDRYEEFLEHTGSNISFSKWKENEIVAEMNRRHRKWLADGRPLKYSIESGANPKDFEKATAKALGKLGFECEFKRRSHFKASPDVVMNGEIWEFKSPEGSGKQTIYHQFEEAAHQSSRLVIDLRRCPIGFDTTLAKCEKLIRYRYNAGGTIMQFDEVLLLDGERLIRIKR